MKYYAYDITGAGYTTQTKEMQTVASIYSLPQMSASAVTNALSNKNDYPFFARTICTDTTVVSPPLSSWMCSPLTLL